MLKLGCFWTGDVKKDEVCTEAIASDQRPPVSKSNSGSEQLAKVAESSEEDSELADGPRLGGDSPGVSEEEQERIVSQETTPPAATSVVSEITAAE